MKTTGVHWKQSITPAELRQRLDQRIATELLDVRSAAEYAGAHLPQSTLVPLADLEPGQVLGSRPYPEAPLFILCQSGARARKAIEQFKRAGFDNCVLVEGGMDACIEAGLPVIRGAVRVLPLMRQVQIVVGGVIVTFAILALALDPRFALVPLLAGGGLLFAGVTGKCGLAAVLARMPWNRRCESCCSTKGV